MCEGPEGAYRPPLKRREPDLRDERRREPDLRDERRRREPDLRDERRRERRADLRWRLSLERRDRDRLWLVQCFLENLRQTGEPLRLRPNLVHRDREYCLQLRRDRRLDVGIYGKLDFFIYLRL